MKKFICIMLTFAMAAALFACAKEAKKPDVTSTRVADTQPSAEDNSETQTVISGIDIDPETGNQLCSVPLAPTGSEELMLQAAYRAMSKEFEGAIVKNHKVLQLGKIGGRSCKRILFETDKGEFIAIINEDCNVLDTWSEGEEKTMEYWFPQMWDITVASDENLCIAFHAFHGDEHYKNGIILDYRQEMSDFTDGSTTCKVTFITTSGDFTVLIAEDVRVVSRTK